MRSIALYSCVFILASSGGALAATAYATSNVNLRAGAGTTNEIVAKIPAGSRVESSNCAEGWCEIEWQGKKGFVIQTALDTSGRAPARRAPPRRAYTVDDEYVPMGPPGYYEDDGPILYGPPVVYGPYWGPRPYWGWRRYRW